MESLGSCLMPMVSLLSERAKYRTMKSMGGSESSTLTERLSKESAKTESTTKGMVKSFKRASWSPPPGTMGMPQSTKRAPISSTAHFWQDRKELNSSRFWTRTLIRLRDKDLRARTLRPQVNNDRTV